MRAFAVRGFGEPPSILDLPVPAADGEFLVAVRFAGVNPLDNSLLGRLKADSPYPFVVGIDFAGIADRVAPGDHGLRAGDRMFGMARTHRSYAEYTAIGPDARLEPVARIPDGVADDQAAALPTSAITALRTVDVLQVSAGQRVVVMGATGGVGGYAVQLARSRGPQVIATVRGDVDEARRLGAHDSKIANVIDAVHAAHPPGVDAVLDLISGPDAIRRDAEIIRPGGRLVSTIFAADEAWFAQRQITAHNHASSANPLISAEGLTKVAQLLAAGTITTRIRATVGLDAAGQVLEQLRSGGLRGKAVIRISRRPPDHPRQSRWVPAGSCSEAWNCFSQAWKSSSVSSWPPGGGGGSMRGLLEPPPWPLCGPPLPIRNPQMPNTTSTTRPRK